MTSFRRQSGYYGGTSSSLVVAEQVCFLRGRNGCEGRGEARQRPQGARIFFGSSRVCSSGFAWNAPGAGRFMLSAGHCYTSSSGTFGAVNRKNANGQLNAIGSVTYSSVASYGTVAGRHGDFAVYELSGDKDNLGKIFVGP